MANHQEICCPFPSKVPRPTLQEQHQLALIAAKRAKAPPKETICAFVNDRDDFVLGRLVDQLGSLEDGALATVEEWPEVGCRVYSIRLDTKYYVCDVQVWSVPSFEALADTLNARKSAEIRALMVCGSRNDLTTCFLARTSQFAKMDSVEVKALILKDSATLEVEVSPNRDRIAADVIDDARLEHLAISRGIEIISIADAYRKHNPDVDFPPDELGTVGFARVQEILETVQWPGLQRKPNPHGGGKGRQKQQKSIRAAVQQQFEQMQLLDEVGGNREETPGLDPFGAKKFDLIVGQLFPGGLEPEPDRNEQNEGSRKLVQNFILDELANDKFEISAIPGTDYPDSGDEEAILAWFDQRFSADDKNPSKSGDVSQPKVTPPNQLQDHQLRKRTNAAQQVEMSNLNALLKKD